MKYECFEVDNKINKDHELNTFGSYVKNIVPHHAQKGIEKKSQVKRATKSKVNNDIQSVQLYG